MPSIVSLVVCKR